MTMSYPEGKARTLSGATAASRVFEALKRDLISGHFEAGEKLAIGSLQTHYQVGLSPLREALNRLAAYGLLDQLHQRGFRVPSLDISELEDIVRLRIQLECMALVQAFQSGDAEWESQLLAAQHRLHRADQTPAEIERWEQSHKAFHRTLLAPCGSPWLLRFIEQLHDQFDRYRRLAPGEPTIRKMLDRQHVELVELALGRHIHEARELLESHIHLSHKVAIESCQLK